MNVPFSGVRFVHVRRKYLLNSSFIFLQYSILRCRSHNYIYHGYLRIITNLRFITYGINRLDNRERAIPNSFLLSSGLSIVTIHKNDRHFVYRLFIGRVRTTDRFTCFLYFPTVRFIGLNHRKVRQRMMDVP